MVYGIVKLYYTCTCAIWNISTSINYTSYKLAPCYITMCSCERKTPNLNNNFTHILINCFQITWKEGLRVYYNILPNISTKNWALFACTVLDAD